MDHRKILSHTDHTLLRTTATWDEIQAVCDEGMAYQTASVCIPPCYVAEAAAYVQGRLPICTVIGFPNGNSTTESKVLEAEQAVRAGAAEIDMVINLGWLKARKYEELLREIRAVRQACRGRILKVIIEVCLLSEQEIIRMCGIVKDSGADYIKTSTGFSAGGVTEEAVALMVAHSHPQVKVKAAGGIRVLADAERFLSLGADRLGSSSVVKLIREENKNKGE